MSSLLPHRNKYGAPVPARGAPKPDDRLLYIDRQAKYIQRHLQTLIDAQSEGLLAGLGGQNPEESVSNGSLTPTSSERTGLQGPRTIPVRQPTRKKIGLRGAREGILRSMNELLSLREDEQDILSMRLDDREGALGEVDNLIGKRLGLQKSITDIQQSGEGQHTTELKQEARTLEAEIRELETKLLEMKVRHRQVLDEITVVENSVEANLSSYKASLALLDSNIRAYLQSPPVEPLTQNTKETTFYSLPPKRRTLEMAKEHWQAEHKRLHKRREEVGLEIEALDEGGNLWKQVINQVSSFEKRLRAEMYTLMRDQSDLVEADDTSRREKEDQAKKNIIKDLERTSHAVEEKLDHAEEKDWKLLICCIGAELEALREAREMLLGVFDRYEDDASTASKGKAPERQEHHESSETQSNPDPPADLLRDSGVRSHEVSRSEDEDDEPDPAWLLPET
ncbi:hypothetical protein ASPZODRAFT_18159 [Penicilliopsis zonata CBS 506.65]|uniref:Autophagy-related protein Atg28 n=1 Tax=Penicilliopsis zonata CBS 506.65 TaxID=1073090 RepID=A0A1L9SBM7_9EURO|nr:hypothetical protein ASPZODRAFT_18159 [Penicilliopsis zonata CBS 506.65]OJJ44581.1 hypothetical protein ASPZODRAFT_18159 [Penicilliopsis zonata CBS 506.65]